MSPVMSDLVTFELLAAVAMLSEEGSYSRAARKLGITASLLKSRITALEDQLGFRIFRAQNRQLNVTEQGTIFIQVSGIFLTEIGKIRSQETSK
jgi:DNA-binding transcriptional LysR family regulator